MYFLIKSVLTITEPGSILVDDWMLESQKHWITCKSRDTEEGLGVWVVAFGGSAGLGFDFKGLWRLNAVFLVTISYLFQSVILSNSIVSATLRDDIFVSIVTCFISWVLVIIRVPSIMLCSFTFSYFYTTENQQNKYHPILWQIIPDHFWLIQFISLSDIPSWIIQSYPFLFHFSITLNYILCYQSNYLLSSLSSLTTPWDHTDSSKSSVSPLSLHSFTSSLLCPNSSIISNPVTSWRNSMEKWEEDLAELSVMLSKIVGLSECIYTIAEE